MLLVEKTPQKKINTKSDKLFDEACKVLPGGVNSPARSCKSVDSTPIFIGKADGSRIFDVDENEYIDYVGSWGPMILGHRHPRVLEAIELALENGISYGAPCRQEVELAQLVCQMMPSIEMVRFVNSGTEATMSAIRLARGFTGRDLIVKFDGCYHGHADSFLVKAGSGLATLGISNSKGVPEDLAKLTISIAFNDVDALKKVFKEHKGEIAAVIVEPIVGNAGLLLPKEGYLQSLRNICTENESLLIFDEVMTGFRVAPGGAQELYGIKPDLTTLGKVIGGGLPVGAYGGRADIMKMVAPLGEVYQAGTLSGNPLAMACGVAQLRIVKTGEAHKKLNANTDKLIEGIQKMIDEQKINAIINKTCGMFTVFFTKEDVYDFESAKSCDTKKFAQFWQNLLEEGVYWPPSQFEAAFMSTMHTDFDIDETLKAFKNAFKNLD